jgi:hypothetical protein
MARPAAARQQQWHRMRCESFMPFLPFAYVVALLFVFSLPVLLALDGAWHIVGEVGGGGVLAVDVAVAWRAYGDG